MGFASFALFPFGIEDLQHDVNYHNCFRGNIVAEVHFVTIFLHCKVKRMSIKLMNNNNQLVRNCEEVRISE